MKFVLGQKIKIAPDQYNPWKPVGVLRVKHISVGKRSDMQIVIAVDELGNTFTGGMNVFDAVGIR